MNHKLLNKLAITNIKNNSKTVVPYLIAGSLTVMIYYILFTLANCPFIYREGKEAFSGAGTISLFMEIGVKIVGVFAVIFLFYANNFVMKSRRREVGLYGILGLSKKNIAVLLGLETAIYAAISIGSGVLIGTIMNKLMLLALYKVIRLGAISGFFISAKALSGSVIFFCILYGIILVYNVSTISLGNPIDLLRSDRSGEREPKVKWLWVVVGLISIAVGYVIALNCKSTMSAISTFFVAVVFVVIGTYCLFTAGSIFILKVLKKNKKYYYKTRHFISVSNLIYRMKHNAVGLASICILSTAFILLMTCASTLLALGEHNINNLFRRDIKLAGYTENANEYYDCLTNSLSELGVSYEDGIVISHRSVVIGKTNDGIAMISDETVKEFDDMASAYILTVDEYNRLSGTDYSLDNDEILLNTSADKAFDSFMVGENLYKVAGEENLDGIIYVTDTEMSLFDSFYIVCSNESVAKEMYASICVSDSYREAPEVYVGVNVKGTLDDTQIDYIKASIAQISGVEIGFKQVDRTFFYNTYGGVFFVGIFLAVLFLMATVMIIYYKQMSEGLQDQKRDTILKNIGLTDNEVRATIKSQVMILFFLPALTAIAHMLVASNIVRLFIGMILVIDNTTFFMAIAVVSVLFLITYAVVYKITSKEYYKIVNAQ